MLWVSLTSVNDVSSKKEKFLMLYFNGFFCVFQSRSSVSGGSEDGHSPSHSSDYEEQDDLEVRPYALNLIFLLCKG